MHDWYCAPKVNDRHDRVFRGCIHPFLPDYLRVRDAILLDKIERSGKLILSPQRMKDTTSPVQEACRCKGGTLVLERWRRCKLLTIIF